MKSDDALLIAWDETLARKREAAAIFDTSGEVLRSFADIQQQARDFADQIEMFDPNRVVGIQLGNHADWPAVLIACLRRKLVVLPLEPSMSEQQRDAALDICCAGGIILGSAGIMPAVRRISRRTSSRSAGGRTPHARHRTSPSDWRTGSACSHSDFESPDWGANPPSLLKLTSGTTAAPQAIRFRSEQLLADCNQICTTMGICDRDLNFGVIPISHSYGFSNLLTPLIARGVPMVVSQDRVPRAVLIDLAQTNATVFPGTPVFYQAFCEMKDLPDLPKLRLCISAGAPLSAGVARNFLNQFKQPVHSFYGSSECGGICYDRDGEVFEDGFVGTPLKDVDLEFIDPTAESSLVRVRSAAVGDDYFPEPEKSKLGNGIFTPDDLLAPYAAGLKIVGRVSDVINVAGKKVNPALVEEQLLRFSGVRKAVAFGRRSLQRNEDVAACVVTNGKVKAEELIDFCRAGLSPWQVPKKIFIVDEIPVSERGKISRRDLARCFGA